MRTSTILVLLVVVFVAVDGHVRARGRSQISTCICHKSEHLQNRENKDDQEGSKLTELNWNFYFLPKIRRGNCLVCLNGSYGPVYVKI
jgi:hypothetical protein